MTTWRPSLRSWAATGSESSAASSSAARARARCPDRDRLAGHVAAFAKILTRRTPGQLAAWITAVNAGDQPDLHSFTTGLEQDLAAVTAALTQPPFLLATRETPGVLVLSIPDKVQVEHGKVSGTSWSFNAVFSRDGGTLGQSAESCGENKLSDCTDQLQSDVRSAAGVGQ